MTYEENLLALLESYKAGTIDAKTALEKLHAADCSGAEGAARCGLS